jgi:hypothetical protein
MRDVEEEEEEALDEGVVLQNAILGANVPGMRQRPRHTVR